MSAWLERMCMDNNSDLRAQKKKKCLPSQKRSNANTARVPFQQPWRPLPSPASQTDISLNDTPVVSVLGPLNLLCAGKTANSHILQLRWCSKKSLKPNDSEIRPASSGGFLAHALHGSALNPFYLILTNQGSSRFVSPQRTSL